MKRREFITGLVGTAAWPVAARGQASTTRPNIAIFFGGAPEAVSHYLRSFLQGMREFGYVEGQNFELAARYAEGRQDRYLPLAEELVRLKSDVIVTPSFPATAAAKKATATIPIVSASLIDPVGYGWAESFPRPGGQVTGLVWNVESLPGKQIGLAREVVPSTKRIGMLIGATSPDVQRQAEIAAAAFDVELVPVEARGPADLDVAFQTWTRARVDLLLMISGPLIISEHKRIVALAAAAHLPALYAWPEIVEAGGLMSYGIDFSASVRRTAFYVDRILKGTKPGELPIEVPTKFEMVINLKTAKALGLTVSPTLVAGADKVIE